MFVTVTPCVEEEPKFTLPKLALVGLNDSVRVAATPVPVKAIVAGEFGALLTIETLPLTEPATVGWKATLNVLDDPGLMDNGRVKPLVLKPVPVTFACVIVRTALPVLLT